jgi:phage recombination protein Bet
MSNEVVKYTWNDEELTLTKKDVRELIATSPNVTDREIERFMALCKYRHLNPFLREAYLIKYGNDPAQNVTGIETFTKRAAKNKNYNGFIPRNNYDETKNKMDWWSEVEIHLANLKFPIIKRVYYEEYVGTTKDGRITKMWRTKPRTMLDKVALMQGLRLALPEEFGGLYEESELDQQGEPNFKDVTPKPEPTEPEEEPVEEAEVEEELEVEEEVEVEGLSDKQSAFVKKNFLSSSYLSDEEKKKYTKEFNDGMTKARASELIFWWIGEKDKGIKGERQKREEQEKEIKKNMKEAGLVKDEEEPDDDENMEGKLDIIDIIKNIKKQKYITLPQFKKMAYGKDVKELDKLTLDQLQNVLNKVEIYQNRE